MNPSPNPGASPGSSSDEPVFIVMGKLRKPHGVRGEMVTTVLTDFPEMLEPGQQVYVGEAQVPLVIRSVRWHRDDMLIGFEGYQDRDEIGIYRNHLIFLPESDFPELPEEEFYFHDLIGLEVITDQGQRLGRLKEILVTGANDVYLVQKDDQKEILLPATEEVILDIDLDEGRILVHLLPGLIDEG